jgi:hypothetical protein
MILFESRQIIRQLEPRKGSYFYAVVPAEVVQRFPRQRNTRLLCTIDRQLIFPCGLNHLGDGNFFLILSTKNMKSIQKGLGDTIDLVLTEDPNPLGVKMPEVLEVLLSQQDELRQQFEALTPGKQRNVIHTILKIKDMDKQVQTALTLIREGGFRRGER